MVSFKERFSKKVNIEEDRIMKSNIVSVNILKTKINPNVYGIDLLLKTSLYFSKRDNPLKDEIFKKIEEIKKELDEIDCGGNKKLKRRNELQEETNKLYNEIAKENSFLRGCDK